MRNEPRENRRGVGRKSKKTRHERGGLKFGDDSSGDDARSGEDGQNGLWSEPQKPTPGEKRPLWDTGKNKEKGPVALRLKPKHMAECHTGLGKKFKKLSTSDL